MGRSIALCILPALLACLAFALAFEAFSLGFSALCGLCLAASGVLFALGCFKTLGAFINGHFRRELERRGSSAEPVSKEELASLRKTALALCGAGLALLALGFVLGGAPLVNVLRFIVSQ